MKFDLVHCRVIVHDECKFHLAAQKKSVKVKTYSDFYIFCRSNQDM